MLLSPNSEAATTDFKLVDKTIEKQVLEKSDTSKDDVKIYKNIFAAMEKNDLEKADELTKKLKGNALIGHILAQKYLHKNYKSSYKELKEWLKKYPDLPQYASLKALSVVKNPNYKPNPVVKQKPRIYANYSWYTDKYEGLSAENRKYVQAKALDFLKAIRNSKNDEAAKIMQEAKFRKIIPNRSYDAMAATLTSAYFLEGNNEEALKWSKKAIARSNDATACWFGGLAAWREKNYKLASSYFGKLAAQHDNDEWLVSGGAFWAYRANIRLKKPSEAKKYLEIAAKYKRTFYGVLSEYLLAQKIDYQWEAKAHYNDFVDLGYKNELIESPIIRRAILLLMAGQNDLAESDLKKNYTKLSKKQKELVLFLSQQYSLANLGFVIGNHLENRKAGKEYGSFIYPRPEWKPKDGWSENQAWIWSLVRQESLFLPKVRSHAGACGLMQVMPATAAQMTKDKSLKTNWRPLLDKKNNLAIGQSYVTYLRNSEYIGNNIFFLAAAYNGGHTNLQKWLDRHDYKNDPLLFVEMIPWKETRLYTKRVVANYWMYNSQMGKQSQSLQQLLDAKWPMIDE